MYLYLSLYFFYVFPSYNLFFLFIYLLQCLTLEKHSDEVFLK